MLSSLAILLSLQDIVTVLRTTTQPFFVLSLLRSLILSGILVERVPVRLILAWPFAVRIILIVSIISAILIGWATTLGSLLFS